MKSVCRVLIFVSAISCMQASGSNINGYMSAYEFDNLFPDRDAIYDFRSLDWVSSYFPDFCKSEGELLCFLATIDHESGGLHYRREINGREHAERYGYEGGSNYYGRGPIQLTGITNYRNFGNAIWKDLVSYPDIVADVGFFAFLSAVWYWMQECHWLFTKDTYTPNEVFDMLETVTSVGIRPVVPNMDNRKHRLSRIMDYLGYQGYTECDIGVYTVKATDQHLYGISLQYGWNLDELEKANPQLNRDANGSPIIYHGIRLNIPEGATCPKN